MDRNHLNNFERGPTKDHSCEVWSKSNQWFRRCCLKIVDGRTDGRTYGRRRRRTVSDHKSSPWAFSSGELKKLKMEAFFFFFYIKFAKYKILCSLIKFDQTIYSMFSKKKEKASQRWKPFFFWKGFPKMEAFFLCLIKNNIFHIYEKFTKYKNTLQFDQIWSNYIFHIFKKKIKI